MTYFFIRDGVINNMGSMIKKIYFDLDGVLADFDYAIYMFGGFKNGECHDSEVKKDYEKYKTFFL